MQDRRAPRAPHAQPDAHEDTYRNDPPVERLPHDGATRAPRRSPSDPTSGHVDEHRHRPGKDSQDES